MAEPILLHNARIRTMDPARPWADWVLMSGGRVQALGKGDPPACRQRIDAGGRLVLPGFQDAHIHLLSGGTDLATAASLYDAAGLDELLAVLKAHAASHPELPVVLGAGWQPGIFGDHNLTADLLDRVVADRPAVIYDNSFHNACLNSRALAMACLLYTSDAADE